MTRRTKPSVEEPLQLDAGGLRKALAIGSDLIASPTVDHVRQQRAWDCGLACVLMAAPHARRQTKSEVKWNDVEKACGTRSVWTVDLAFALRALGCRDFLFLTKTTGCDPSYARLAFYRRDLGADSTRIQSLFRRAQQGEVSVKRAVATRDGLLEVLRTGRVLAIALVDLRLLHARAARTSLLPRSYTGHYVLLVGAEGDRVRYRDPAADRAELVIDEFDFDPGKGNVLDAVQILCLGSWVHPIHDYLDSLVWDQKPRLSGLLADYFGAEHTELNQAISAQRRTQEELQEALRDAQAAKAKHTEARNRIKKQQKAILDDERLRSRGQDRGAVSFLAALRSNHAPPPPTMRRALGQAQTA